MPAGYIKDITEPQNQMTLHGNRLFRNLPLLEINIKIQIVVNSQSR